MINIYNETNNLLINFDNVINDVERGFKQLNYLNDQDLSIIIVDIQKIQEINKTYRHLDKPTDVISFEDDEDGYIGDIFICSEKVKEQADLYQHSLEREFAFLVCHGILHLLGYDHLNEADEKEMFSKQDEILNYIGYTRN